jgi:hypothetical protein
MALKETSLSCTVYQSWKYGQTGGSAGGSKYCTGTMTVNVYQRWGWDGSSWQRDGDRIDSSPATYNYGPDSEGYSGKLNRTSVSGTPLQPTRNGAYFGESIQTQISGTAYYGATLTKADTRTYGWATNGSLSHNASSSTYYDDGAYEGWLYLYSVTGSPPSPSGSGSIGDTTTTSTSGTAYYSGDIPLKPISAPTNFRKVNQSDQTSILLAWNSVTGANSYSLEAYNKGTTSNPVSQNYGIGGTSKIISGLTTGKRYDFKLYSVGSSGNSSPTWLYDILIEDLSPSAPQNLRVVVENGTKAILTWDSVSGASNYSAEIYLHGTSTVVKSAYLFSGNSVEFSGLDANKNYTAKVYGNNTYGTGTPSYENFSTSLSRPANWEWSSLVSSRRTNPNITYSGVIPLSIVNASDWNSFTACINEFRKYKKLSVVAFTTVNPGNAITDTIYFQAVNAINPMATVSQPVGFYSRLVALKNALNSIT